MSRRSRIPGPIASTTTGNSDAIAHGESRWQSIDLNNVADGWVKYDPSNLLVGVTTSENGMRFELDVAQNNKRWNATAQNTGRYYRQFAGPFGLLTWADRFSIEFIIELNAITGNTSTCDRAGIVVGLCDADVTSGNSVHWVGMTALTKAVNPNGLQGQIGGDSNVANGTGNTTQKLYGVIGPAIDDTDAADTNPQIRSAFMYNIDANGDLVVSTAAANQQHEYTVTDPLYMFVAPSFGSTVNNLTNNPDVTFKMWYRINQAPDALSPTYIPKSGVSV